MSWKLKNFSLQVASSFSRVESLRSWIYELKVYDDNVYKLRSCLLQDEHLRCQFYKLSSHVWM